MRTSQFFLSTSKEAPAEAELVSHKLMLRAGLIKRLGSGLYTWMPLGLRILRKVETIVREEMNRAGAIELLMPAVIPAELWQESGRWDVFGPQMLKIKDRHQRDFLFGPTHEEVITDLARKEIRSYRQLPVNFYQIQTKFRDEIRPRFGVMRAREFLMKDAYSFHADAASLDATYRTMYDTYSRIFTRLGLKFRAVAADTGAIGGSGSHEFHVLADSGEDAIAYCPNSDYAANVEMAEGLAPAATRAAATQAMQKMSTPGQHSIEEVSAFFNVPKSKILKTLIVEGHGGLVAFLLRGDHELNMVKAEKLSDVFSPLRFATENQLDLMLNRTDTHVHASTFAVYETDTQRAVRKEDELRFREAEYAKLAGSLGPVGLPIRIIADRAVANMSDFICGANEPGYHLTGVNFGRDLPEPVFADLRNAVEGDPSPDGQGKLELCRGIEVGHIFKLGTKYSEALEAKFLDEQGKSQTMVMGCYGIGVSRIVAAAIEQGHDERGIVFPKSIAPFELAIVALGYRKNPAVKEAADALYNQLKAADIDVVLDDRDERPGVMFADMELIGVPHRVVVSERSLKEGQLEYQGRQDSAATKLPQAEAAKQIEERVKA